MYRTGDRGRIHLDGRLELLGRVDRELKVRDRFINRAHMKQG